MIPAILFGTGTGVGLWTLLVWAIPPTPALHDRLAHATATPPAKPLVTTHDTSWVTTLGRPFTPALRALGLPRRHTERDLRVLGRGVDTFLASKAILALTGLLAPVLLQLLLAVGGLALGLEVPLVAAIVLAAL